MKKFFIFLFKIFLLIFFLLFSIAAIFIYKEVQKIRSEQTQQNQIFKENQESLALEQVRKIAEGDENNFWIGSDDPKITIVEFSDFECPYCAQTFPKIRELSLKYKDKIKVIYRDTPLHDNSIELSKAARCAGVQDKFWIMHDKLFQNQGKLESRNNILNLAQSIGLDVTKFNSCLDSNTHMQYIQKDFSDATSLGINGTPTWYVNGNKLEGDVPMEVWEKIIKKLLNT